MNTNMAARPKGSIPGTVLLVGLVLSACQGPAPAAGTDPSPTEAVYAREAAGKWDWFDIEMTDVQTGETFTLSDFAGKVVLVETMAIWCPNCILQANEVRNLHELLGNPDDLVSVTLDVDVNEDAPALKEYAYGYGFEWHFAVAPLGVARALGNLYSPQYLNPPLSPMLSIDREGNVRLLGYGTKRAETLLEHIEPLLAP